MQIKQRNIYLQRISEPASRKYTYSIEKGKYLLLNNDGSEQIINKIGTFTPKFRNHFTGFASAKNRHDVGSRDHSALHYTPISTFRVRRFSYTPMTSKFIGYNQLPYKLKNREMPEYLCIPLCPQRKKYGQRRQSQSYQNKRSNILTNNSMEISRQGISDTYYKNSLKALYNSKPLPRSQKKSCFDNRCNGSQYCNRSKNMMKSTLATEGLGNENYGMSKICYYQLVGNQGKKGKLGTFLGKKKYSF